MKPTPLSVLIRLRETRARLRDLVWAQRWPVVVAQLRVQRATAP